MQLVDECVADCIIFGRVAVDAQDGNKPAEKKNQIAGFKAGVLAVVGPRPLIAHEPEIRKQFRPRCRNVQLNQ
jgi:hypothetical protein